MRLLWSCPDLKSAVLQRKGFGRELPVQVLSGTAASAKSEVPDASTLRSPSHGTEQGGERTGRRNQRVFFKEGGT